MTWICLTWVASWLAMTEGEEYDLAARQMVWRVEEGVGVCWAEISV